MEQPNTSSNSSSFEDLAKESDGKDGVDFMDILGNNQLTKKVGQRFRLVFRHILINLWIFFQDSGERIARNSTSATEYLYNQLHWKN
jgi:hypothetical protein